MIVKCQHQANTHTYWDKGALCIFINISNNGPDIVCIFHSVSQISRNYVCAKDEKSRRNIKIWLISIFYILVRTYLGSVRQRSFGQLLILMAAWLVPRRTNKAGSHLCHHILWSRIIGWMHWQWLAAKYVYQYSHTLHILFLYVCVKARLPSTWKAGWIIVAVQTLMYLLIINHLP